MDSERRSLTTSCAWRKNVRRIVVDIMLATPDFHGCARSQEVVSRLLCGFAAPCLQTSWPAWLRKSGFERWVQHDWRNIRPFGFPEYEEMVSTSSPTRRIIKNFLLLAEAVLAVRPRRRNGQMRPRFGETALSIWRHLARTKLFEQLADRGRLNTQSTRWP